MVKILNLMNVSDSAKGVVVELAEEKCGNEGLGLREHGAQISPAAIPIKFFQDNKSRGRQVFKKRFKISCPQSIFSNYVKEYEHHFKPRN